MGLPIKDGPFVLWGPYLSADDVRRMRGDLCDLIEAISRLEGLQCEVQNKVLTRAMRGPLSDLLLNLHYFAELLQVLKAQKATRAETAARAWRLEGFDDRRA